MALDKIAPLGHIGAMHTVAETAHYSHRAVKLLSESEQDEVVMAIAANPLVGNLIEGTGGLRKMRFGKGGRGKSGGVRVVYYCHDGSMPTLLMAIFGKNEKDNLNKAERNALGAVVADIKRQWRRRVQ
jgi:hypothetical protein